MKIGILTFHWATNYGAILQAFCLQEYLNQQGHDVAIINYKPKQYDFSLMKIVLHPRLWKGVLREINNFKKEQLLIPFRKSFLRTTHRYYTIESLENDINTFDVIISGSDQVLNPGFTTSGENNKPTPVYWLGFSSKSVKRLGYAVSFGCEVYPEDAANFAKQWVNGFDAIGVREQTGLDILEQLGYKGYKSLLPDPTLLLGKQLFQLTGVAIPQQKRDYTCVYMLRHEIQVGGNVKYIDDKHHPVSMVQWLTIICGAQHLITNSYHGMIMAMLSHVSFVVLLEEGTGKGMNDRLFTLIEKLGVKGRTAYSVDEALNVLKRPLDFEQLDIQLSYYRELGVDFLDKYLVK